MRCHVLIKRTIIALLAFLGLQVHAASIDCRKAITSIEKLVCSDQRLSELDEVLTLRYEESLSKSNLPGRNRLRNEQKKWLRDQRGNCSNIDCLKDLYEKRIQIIKAFPREVLECPQCGAWQISGSNVQWMNGDILHVDETHVEIDGCVVFEVIDINTDVSGAGDERKTYKITSKLKPLKQFLLCSTNTPAWQLNIEVSGHFKEGGYAEFNLVSGNGSGLELSFHAWNIYREDPCSAGSGRGHAECMVLSNAILLRSLTSLASIAREDDYYKEQLRNGQLFFDPEHFVHQITSYCSEKEKDSGGGLWPTAWALTCINNLLNEKHNEFNNWQKCITQTNASVQCTVPDNRFVKTPSHVYE